MMRKSGYFWMFIFLLGCTHMRKKKPPTENGNFLEYSVSGTEDDENVHCRFRFLKGGPEGNAAPLPPNARLTLDGMALQADSAGLSGVFYEADRPLDSFRGKHAIVFTDADHHNFRDEFVFSSFELDDLDSAVARHPFLIQLKNFDSRYARVHLVMVDTSFRTNDVNEIMNISNGMVPVTGSMLSRLKNGPIDLEIYRVEEHGLKKANGKLTISYGLQRQFELTE
ncbi:MAG: hypothetical protein ACJ75B_14165 [Flavisolibacter sp.]